MVHTEPDHAIVRLAVNRVSTSPRASFDEAKSAVAAVRASLRSNGISDENVRSSQVGVHSAWNGHGADRMFLGHQCRVQFSVRIEKLDLVEQAVVDMVDAGADEIVEILYDTSHTEEWRAEAWEKAVAAAHTKARLYAEAANVRLGPVVHIEDVEPERLGAPVYRGAAMGAGGGRGDDLAPGQVTVSAAVVLGFSITR